MTTYSKELCEHHRTIINHAEADLRCTKLLLDANEHLLAQARMINRDLKAQLEAAQALFWVLTACAFISGVCLMGLLRMMGVI